MTDNQSTGGASGSVPAPSARAFPLEKLLERMLFAILFAVVAWFVFWVAVLLAVLQFVATAISGNVNGELRGISQSVTLYLEQLVAYFSLVRDDRPFPLGPFPKQ